MKKTLKKKIGFVTLFALPFALFFALGNSFTTSNFSAAHADDSAPDEVYDDTVEEEASHTKESGHSDWQLITAAYVDSNEGYLVGSEDENSPNYFYLEEDTTLETNNITITGYAVICLNGRMLKGNGSGTLITIGDETNTGNLIVYDCIGDEENETYAHNYYSSSYYYHFDDQSEATGTIYGGIITGGNSTNYAGGIRINSNSTFTMYGGTITGNYAGSDGGAMYIDSDAKFIMKNGAIIGNYSNNCGGGIHATGTFTMYDGEITDNISQNWGGGVRVEGTFEMYAGIVAYNYSRSGGNNAARGNVWLDGNFYMYGGTLIAAASSYYAIGTNSNITAEIYNGYVSSITGSYITVYGGYLGSVNEQNIAEGRIAVDISSLGKTLDENYNPDFPYAVYETYTTDLSSIEDIEEGVSYGESISFDFEAIDHDYYIVDGNLEDAGIHEATVYFFKVNTIEGQEGEEDQIKISVTSATFNITINKAIPTINFITESTKVYDGQPIDLDFKITVGNIDITDEAEVYWYSVDSDNNETYLGDGVKPVNAGKYNVVIDLAGTDNYYGYTFSGETYTITKATYPYEIPLDLIAEEGDYLYDVGLPEGWSWIDGETLLDTAGTDSFLAEYEPDDLTNYQTSTEYVSVTVYHQIGDWIQQSEPSCTSTGTKGHYVCSYCNRYIDADGLTVIDDIVIPMSDHDYTKSNNNETYHWIECSVCSQEQQGTREPHYSDTWLNDTVNNEHYKVCSCGEQFDRSSHSDTDISYTNTSGSTHDVVCDDCGLTIESGVAHTEAYRNTEGNTHDVYCSVCNQTLATDVTHTSTGTNVATCTTLAVCDDCGVSYGQMLDHDYTKSNSDETHHWTECSVCGDIDETSKVSHSGHEYINNTDDSHTVVCSCGITISSSEQHTTGDWLTTDDGQHYKVCDYCNAELYKDYHQEDYVNTDDETTHNVVCSVCEEVIRSEDHNFGEWVVTTEPTETETGERVKTCENCGYYETEVLEATGETETPDVDEPEADDPEVNVEEPVDEVPVDDTDNDGLSAGAIAGIVIACLIGILAIAYGVCALLYKKGILVGSFFEKIYPFIKKGDEVEENK